MRDADIKILARTVLRAQARHAKLQARVYDPKGCSHVALTEAQEEAREALAVAVYLVQHLDRRHDAKRLADACGIPGYINNRCV